MKHFIAGLALLGATAAAAQVDELENPGTVSAVQDRAFRMEHELALSFGLLPLDAFTKSIYGQVAYAYHFNDWFAWQVGRFGYAYNISTGLREQLERDFGVLPTAFDQVQYFIGSDLMFTPFYVKGALVNRFVLHGEFYFVLGAAVFKYTNAFRPGVNFGGGFRLFFTQWVSARLDLTNTVVVVPLPPTNVLSLNVWLAINFGASE